ncbi:MAG: oligosaccharide repeat unit polymerase [Carnobacterium maltaromaticum]
MIKGTIVILMIVSIGLIVNKYFQNKNWLTVENIAIVSFLILFDLPIFLQTPNWAMDEQFLILILIGNVGFIGAFLFMHPTKEMAFIVKTEKATFSLKKDGIRMLTLLVFCYLAYELYQLQAYNFSIVRSTLLNDRVGEYFEDAGTQNLGFIKQGFTTLNLLLISYYWKHKNHLGTLLWICYFIITLLSAHTRFVVVVAAVIPLVYYNYQIKPIKLSTLIGLGIIFLLFITISNYARGGVLGKGDSRFSIDEIMTGRNMKDQLFRASAGSTEHFHTLFTSDVPNDWLRQYYYFIPLSFVPRVLWSNKPVVSYFWRVTQSITGAYPNGKMNPVLTTTYLGEAYHQIGWIGVLIATFIYFKLLFFCLNTFKKFEYSELLIYSSILWIPMSLRGGFSSLILTQVPTFLILYGLKVIHVYEVGQIKYKKEGQL